MEGVERMKTVTTQEVADYWREGIPACNNGSNFWTDGSTIYSYRLIIGETTTDGEKLVQDYSANTRLGFKSMTTSKHVGYARRYADLICDGVEIRRWR